MTDSDSASPIWNRIRCCRNLKHACGGSKSTSTRTAPSTTSRCPAPSRRHVPARAGLSPADDQREDRRGAGGRRRAQRRDRRRRGHHDAVRQADEGRRRLQSTIAPTRWRPPICSSRPASRRTRSSSPTSSALSGSPPDAEIPSLTLLNGYTARLVTQNELNLREVWLRTELFGQRLALTTGRLDLTNYFDANAFSNDESTQFLSDALVNNQMLGPGEQRHRRRRRVRSQERLPAQVRLAAEQQRRDQPVGFAVHVERGRLHVHAVRAAGRQLPGRGSGPTTRVGDIRKGVGHQRRPEADATPSACSRATARRTSTTTVAITTGAPASASRTASSSIRRTPGASAIHRWTCSPAIVRSWWRATTTCCSPSGCGCRSTCTHVLETPAGGEQVRLSAAGRPAAGGVLGSGSVRSNNHVQHRTTHSHRQRASRPGVAAAASHWPRGAGTSRSPIPTSVVMIVNRDSNDIGFMDIKTKKMIGNVFLGNNVNPHMVMMSPDGRYVVTGGTRANKAFIIDTRTLQLVKVIPTDIAPEHLAFSPDSRWYYQGNPDGDSISVIDMQSLSKIKTIPGFVEPLNVTFMPDGIEGVRRQLRRALGGRDRRAAARAAQEDPDRQRAGGVEARSGQVPRRDQGHQHRRALHRRPLSVRGGQRPGHRRRRSTPAKTR